MSTITQSLSRTVTAHDSVALRSPDYVTTRYADYFEIVAYIRSGLDSCQDIVLLQRR